MIVRGETEDKEIVIVSIVGAQMIARSESKDKEIARHPVVIALITFVLGGVMTTLFQNWLTNRSKEQDLELQTTQRAADSVKIVTELIFDRAFDANMLASSIKRSAPLDEVKSRKKTYDDAFTSYNARIQSNIFRIREMFGNNEYPVFIKLLQGPLRNLLFAQDECVTEAYDASLKSGSDQRAEAVRHLEACAKVGGKEISYAAIYKVILACEYSFTDSLFKAAKKFKDESVSLPATEQAVGAACKFPTETIPINVPNAELLK